MNTKTRKIMDALKNIGNDDPSLKYANLDPVRLFEKMLCGFALIEILYDNDNIPVDYIHVAVNPAHETLTGVKSSQILNKKITEAMPDIEPLWIDRYGQVAVTGESIEFEEYSHALKKWFKVSAYIAGKGLVGITFTDITIEKELAEKIVEERDQTQALKEKIEKQAQMFNEAFKLSPIATLLMTEEGYVIDANENAEKMLETNSKTLIGYNFLEFTEESDKASSSSCMNIAKNSKTPQKIIKTYVSLKGNRVLCDTTLNYIDKNGDSYFIVQAADITKKQAVKEKVIETMKGIREIANRNAGLTF